MNRPLRGLYAITPDIPAETPDSADRRLIAQVTQAIAGGARLIQYRAKDLDEARRHAQAAALARLCDATGVPLIINDDLELALSVGAGVHLGRDDGDPAAARRRLGADAIIGVSCYDSLDLALTAAAAGASYVAFGSFFPSTIKPRAARPTPDLLTQARARIAVPLVAIGGITPQNARLLIAAGADLLAVITGVFAAPDVAAAARAFSQQFEPGLRPPEHP
ncbi:thiamine phosphate synthase [uncultured Lamprocystis sp.]|jgi:thiamine-phosphate pyrophosphorylase|uniref:thiamine phosphate synthase n=1 Tax=uncultured Lamprocystis sp. TaxID=543132 RepID=UPI0025D1BFC9|nr:thiamine phosphate synthase [uncultured Lamprocystis sp.]